MIDITIKQNGLKKIKVLNIAYTFKRIPNLVADKYGNFFILTHFNHRRTTYFKQLDKSNGYIYCNGIKFYMSTLRQRAVKTTDHRNIN